jgi:WD40 repeat protein
MNSIKRAALLSVLAICFAGLCFGATVPNPRSTLATVAGDVRGVVFSPDGQRIAVSTGQAITVWTWDASVPPGKEIPPIPAGMGAAFSMDNTLVAFPGQDEVYSDGLMLWDIAARKKKLFISDDNVQSPVFSPDGKLIAAAVGSRVKVWKLPGGEEQPAMKDGHKCSIVAIAYSLNGKVMISADGKGTLSRWELGDSGPLKKGEYKHANEEASINSLACSADGKWVAASTGDGLILVLDAATLALSGSIKAHKDGLRVKSIAFSPDNKTIASACSGIEDLEVKLWDAATCKKILGFVGHQGGVNCVAFSPDGKWLASGSDDKSAKVWEVEALLAMNAPKPEKKKEKPAENP